MFIADPEIQGMIEISKTACTQLALKGQRPLVVIEGGYFDTRYPVAPDRAEHVDDSFKLLSELRKTPGKTILLSALVNDFASTPRAGHSIECALPEEPTRQPARGIDLLPREALEIYRQCSGGRDVRDLDLHVFSMTTTRNRALRWIHEKLKADHPSLSLEPGEKLDRQEIVARRGEDDILVASRRGDTGRLVARCSALMAQHYYDLYLLAKSANRDLTSLMIFDFNRFTERDRVRKGAEVTFALYPWPSGLPVCIANCNDSSDPGDRWEVHFTPHA